MNKRQRKKRTYALLSSPPVPSFFTDHLKWLLKRAAEKEHNEQAPTKEAGPEGPR